MRTISAPLNWSYEKNTTIPLAFIPGRHSSGWVETGLNAHLADWNYFFEGIRQNTECDCEHKQTHFFHWWGSFTVWHKSEVVVVYTQLKLFLLTAAPMSVSATFFPAKRLQAKNWNEFQENVYSCRGTCITGKRYLRFTLWLYICSPLTTSTLCNLK